MPEETPVDEIVVVGQRRRYTHETFPSRGSGGGDGGFIEPEEVGDGTEPPPTTPDPCADPETALPWNADAEAAASVGAFLQAAALLGGNDVRNGVPHLGNREFGRMLWRGSGSSVNGNDVSWGEPPDPNGNVAAMTVDTTGINNYNYIGDIHTHPFGTGLPSEVDWEGFLFNNRTARAAGRTQETFYLYIVTVDQNGNLSMIHVYQDGPRAENSPDPARPTTNGPEVNPDAQPCG